MTRAIKLERILVATDFSPAAASAVRYASAFAVQFQTQLHLLSVVQDAEMLSPDPNAPFLIPASNLDEVVTAVQKALKLFPPADLAVPDTVVRKVVKGNPSTEIIKYAKDEDIDMIVVGTSGRSGFMHLLLGSVADKVVRQADCPVLTVRPDGHQFVTA